MDGKGTMTYTSGSVLKYEGLFTTGFYYVRMTVFKQ